MPPKKRITAPIERETHTDAKGRPVYADIANLGAVEVDRVAVTIPGLQTPGRGEDYGDGLGPAHLVQKHTTQTVLGSLLDETGMRLLGTEGWHPFRRQEGFWTKVFEWRRFLVTEETYRRVTQ